MSVHRVDEMAAEEAPKRSGKIIVRRRGFVSASDQLLECPETCSGVGMCFSGYARWL